VREEIVISGCKEKKDATGDELVSMTRGEADESTPTSNPEGTTPMTRTHFRQNMIDDANKTAEALSDSELADELKRHRFTAASMRKAARRLTMLHTRADVAKGHWVSALAALQAEAHVFAQLWSKFSNLVRGLTPDPALRNELGVSSPGRRKTSSLHRGPRLAKTNAKIDATNDVRSPSSPVDVGTGTEGRT
jgi:hypothetical protein